MIRVWIECGINVVQGQPVATGIWEGMTVRASSPGDLYITAFGVENSYAGSPLPRILRPLFKPLVIE
jgi:hypothetical protein